MSQIKENFDNFKDLIEIEGINAKGYGSIAKLVMLDQRLTIEAKAIYSYFCSYAGGGSSAFPSVSKILFDLKISKTRYYKHFKLLTDFGYISVKQIKKENKFSNNVYTLHLNPKEKKLESQNEESGYQNEETGELECPQNDDSQNEYSQKEDSNINNININNFNNLLDDDDDKIEQELTEIIDMYETYSSKKLTKANLMSLSKLVDQVEKDLLLYAIQKLEDVEKPMPYLKSIIKDYVSKNITNVTEALAYDRQFKKQKKNKTKANKINSIIPSPSGTPVTKGYYDWMAELN
ncbi:helix-turn-helix domain-containing protein [uncultured Clostridium sp.]|uniref:helix-turn-helix domain-containing protein n=1 Tax=uncultured Clostridium sp. TaxID=59620 RepID=UPI002622560C|nr:helix-turn-helix domain-containing protein [uncultured Clostridium sp.]